jgi:hypothetical protein
MAQVLTRFIILSSARVHVCVCVRGAASAVFADKELIFCQNFLFDCHMYVFRALLSSIQNSSVSGSNFLCSDFIYL